MQNGRIVIHKGMIRILHTFLFVFLISLCRVMPESHGETINSMADFSQLIEVDPANSTISSASEEMVDANSIVRLTFENNPDIIAARYELEAAEYQFKDFEDALQYHCAAADPDISVIITRNIKDFRYSDLPVMSPATFMASWHKRDH